MCSGKIKLYKRMIPSYICGFNPNKGILRISHITLGKPFKNSSEGQDISFCDYFYDQKYF